MSVQLEPYLPLLVKTIWSSTFCEFLHVCSYVYLVLVSHHRRCQSQGQGDRGPGLECYQSAQCCLHPMGPRDKESLSCGIRGNGQSVSQSISIMTWALQVIGSPPRRPTSSLASLSSMILHAYLLYLCPYSLTWRWWRMLRVVGSIETTSHY